MVVELSFVAALSLAALWAWVQRRARAHEVRAEAAYPPEGELLEIDGHQVHAWVCGTGPDLVLIHGSSGNLRDFTRDLAPVLAREYRVIALDRPGHGYTDRINRTGASITRQADLLQKAAARFGADKPIVLGFSYGGAVALAWAVTRPDNIAALVPVSAASNPWDTGLPAFYRLTSHPVLGPLVIPFLTAFARDERVEHAISGVFAPQDAPDGYVDKLGAGLTLRRDSLRANALQRRNLLAEVTALHHRYCEISVPTEIVHGSADNTVGLPIHAMPLSRQIRGATLTILPGIGHMPHHVAQPQVIAAIHRAAARAGLRPAP